MDPCLIIFHICIGWHHPQWNLEAAIYSTTLSSRFYDGIIINLSWRHHRFIIQIRLVERRSCRRRDIFYRKVMSSWIRRSQCLKNTLTSWGRRRQRGFARRQPSKPSVLLCLSTLLLILTLVLIGWLRTLHPNQSFPRKPSVTFLASTRMRQSCTRKLRFVRFWYYTFHSS